jgi:hypothetical protein
VWGTLAHLIVYNSGSVLNPKEMPSDLLDDILAFASSLDTLHVISLDSREPFIRSEVISRMIRHIGNSRSLHPILGLETIDDYRRNTLLNKRMPEAAVIRAFQEVGRVATEVGPDRVGLDINIVVAGPGTDEITAISDAVATARFAWETGMKYAIRVDLNLHPYYPSARGQNRFPAHKRCSPGIVVQAAREITLLRGELDLEAAVFIGWQDEGHDREHAIRKLELEKARQAFDRFNTTQEARGLEALDPMFK